MLCNECMSACARPIRHHKHEMNCRRRSHWSNAGLWCECLGRGITWRGADLVALPAGFQGRCGGCPAWHVYLVQHGIVACDTSSSDMRKATGSMPARAHSDTPFASTVKPLVIMSSTLLKSGKGKSRLMHVQVGNRLCNLHT